MGRGTWNDEDRDGNHGDAWQIEEKKGKRNENDPEKEEENEWEQREMQDGRGGEENSDTIERVT